MGPGLALALRRCLDQLGQHAEAEKDLRESMDLRANYVGADNWLVGSSEGFLGEHFILVKNFPKAEAALLHANALLIRALGPDNPRTQISTRRLVTLYTAWGKPAKAAEYQARLPKPTP